jgi:hypothetical protein
MRRAAMLLSDCNHAHFMPGTMDKRLISTIESCRESRPRRIAPFRVFPTLGEAPATRPRLSLYIPPLPAPSESSSPVLANLSHKGGYGEGGPPCGVIIA